MAKVVKIDRKKKKKISSRLPEQPISDLTPDVLLSLRASKLRRLVIRDFPKVGLSAALYVTPFSISDVEALTSKDSDSRIKALASCLAGNVYSDSSGSELMMPMEEWMKLDTPTADRIATAAIEMFQKNG